MEGGIIMKSRLIDRQRRPRNEIIINSTSELPTPTDTGDGLGLAHRLVSGNRYKIGVANIYFTYPIVPPSDGSVTIESSEDYNIYWLGTGAFIRNNSNTPLNALQLIATRIIGDGTNTAFSITDGGEISVDFVRILNNYPGTISGIERAYFRNVAVGNQFGKFSFADIAVVLYWQGVVMITGNSLSGDSMLDLSGNIGVVSLQNIEAQPLTFDSFINIDSGFTGRIQMSYVESRDIYGGYFFKPGSLDQTDPKVESRDCVPIADSQTIGSFFMERNTTVTDITAVGTDGIITAFADAGGGQVTVTSAGHGLSNGNIVWIANSTNYASKYTISNVATDTFEITETYTAESPSAITVWETNWTKVAGLTYSMENERASMTDNNKITFTNLEEQKVTIHVANNPRNDQVAATKDWEFSVIKNGTQRLSGSLRYREMNNKAGEGIITATNSVISGDYFEVYARSLSDTTTDMVMENMSVVIE